MKVKFYWKELQPTQMLFMQVLAMGFHQTMEPAGFANPMILEQIGPSKAQLIIPNGKVGLAMMLRLVR